MKIVERPILFGSLAATSVAVVVLVTMQSAAIGLGVLAAGAFITWAIFKPYQAACTIAFFAAAFPKAGVKVGGFPFPVFLFGLLLAVVLIAIHSKRDRVPTGTVVIFGIYLTLVLARCLLIAEAGPSGIFAFIAWAALPLIVLFLMTPVSDAVPGFRRAFEYGFLVAVGYALVQFVAGIDAVAVPGLTYALGDDITEKHNVIFSDTGADFSKIPSTYQNGNIFGLVAAFFFVASMKRIVGSSATRLDWLVAAGSLGSIALSGSRTAIIAGMAGALLIFLRRGSLGRKILIIAAAIGAVWGVLALQPGLVARYSIEDLAETGGAGRSQMWAAEMARLTPVEVLFGSDERRLSEGWVGIILQIGVVGVVLLAAAVILMLRSKPDWRVPFLVLAVGAVVDSSFQTFPTWFIPAAMTAASVMPRNDEKPLQAHRSEPAGVIDRV